MVESSSSPGAGPSIFKRPKLTGYELYKSLGSPKHVVAPMVDAKEEGAEETLLEWGISDRPLLAQFCGNEPDLILSAAKKLQHKVDAVDLNLGCPQHIAKRGMFGSYLQESPDLVFKIINTLHNGLDVPVTAKFRVLATVEATVKYAKMLERAGAQILTCHGRLREQKGHNTGLADWSKIKAVKEAVSVPVFANGNILYWEDIQRCLEFTGCDGVMSAEGNLYNPALFQPTEPHPPILDLARRYLSIVQSLKTPTANSAIKSHIFKLLHVALEIPENADLRNRIAAILTADEEGLKMYRNILDVLEERINRDVAVFRIEHPDRDPYSQAFEFSPLGYKEDIPYWLAQPHMRVKFDDASISAAGTDSVVTEQLRLPSGRCHYNDELCSNMLSANCTHQVCLHHCRIIGALAAGKIDDGADNVGFGCEPHENKVKAKKVLLAERKESKKLQVKEQKKRRKENIAVTKKMNMEKGDGSVWDDRPAKKIQVSKGVGVAAAPTAEEELALQNGP